MRRRPPITTLTDTLFPDTKLFRSEGDVADNGVERMDAILTYKAKGLTFTVGQHNNFQGLGELSSSNDTSFLERAAFTDAFGFQRRLGLDRQSPRLNSSH